MGTCGDPHALGVDREEMCGPTPVPAALCWTDTGAFRLCFKVLGHLVDPALSQGAGCPLLARTVILSGKGT